MRVCPRCNLKYSDDADRCFIDNIVLSEAHDPYVGTTIKGQYLVEHPIGAGGMATVYQAQHTLVDRLVAIKILRPEMARNQQMRERFRREAKNAATLQHPNIIEIYDYGELEDGAAFMVMELLDGTPLNQWIARGPLPVPLVAELGLQISQGLARAHDFEVLHRDLKPENIIVCETALGRHRAVLLDFGIARSMHDSRLTSMGEIFGTPKYMAPERVTSIDAGPSADLYALGAILFEMLTGRAPFEATHVTEYFVKHLQEVPPSPRQFVADVPRELEVLILRLLAKHPIDRPVDAHQVIIELKSLLAADVVAELLAEEVPATTRRKAARLPPTSLEQWAARLQVFSEMLARAFPHHEVPLRLVELESSIRADVDRIHALRSQGLGEQRTLESLETNTRESRARLGHAVESLARDLSTARQQVQDLEYQVRMLREQLERLELEYDRSRVRSDEVVQRCGHEAGVLEQALLTKATDFCGSLRGRPELADLFARL